MHEIVPGITTWSVFSEPMGLDFNGYAIATGQERYSSTHPIPDRTGGTRSRSSRRASST